MKRVCCSQIHFPIGNNRKRHCDCMDRDADGHRGKTNTTWAVLLLNTRLAIGKIGTGHRFRADETAAVRASLQHPFQLPPGTACPGESPVPAEQDSSMHLAGKNGAAATSAHSSLYTATLPDRNKIFTPCEGRGTGDSWAHKPFGRKAKAPQAFCSDQQLPRSMTLDSPTYFVFDNLILYCNNLNYTAALDLHGDLYQPTNHTGFYFQPRIGYLRLEHASLSWQISLFLLSHQSSEQPKLSRSQKLPNST